MSINFGNTEMSTILFGGYQTEFTMSPSLYTTLGHEHILRNAKKR